MSTLLVDELFNGVTFEQRIQIQSSTYIVNVRPWIYKHGTIVDGELTMRVKLGATTLKTVSIDFTELNTISADDYAHGYIRFDTAPMTLNITDTQESEAYILETRKPVIASTSFRMKKVATAAQPTVAATPNN